MSTLSVSNITTPTNTTPLVLSSANSQAAFVRVEAANNDIVFGGTTKFLGTLSASYLQSNSINIAFDVANASFNTANTVSGNNVIASFNTANAAYGTANVSSASLISNWTVTNTVYGVANAAFASANNVAPQVTPAFNTANAAYSYANTVYSSLSASINSNWTVTNTVYGVANTALPNISNPTLAGTLTVSTAGVPQVINSTNSNTYKVALRDNGTTIGFFGGSSSTPFIVANSAVNSLFSVDNVGNFSTTGTLTTSSRGIAKASMPSGSILQVVQIVKTDAWNTSSTTPVDITGMSINITPTSSTSKIMVTIDLKWSIYGHGDIYLLRNGTKIYYGDLYSTQTQSLLHAYDSGGSDDYGLAYGHATYLDSPATTSTVTYKLQGAVPYSSSYQIAVNYMRPNGDATYNSRVASSMTVYEIAV